MKNRTRRPRLATITAACTLVLALLVGFCPGQAAAGQVTLAWDQNVEPDVTGYKVFTGTSSGSYGAPISVGKVTTYTVTGLTDGETYYFVLTAVDAFGNESVPSNEVTHTIPAHAEISLLGNALGIVDGDLTPAAADHTHFGSTDIAGGSVTHTFTIQNAGPGTLTLSGSPRVAVGGANAADFTVTALPADSVPAGGSTTFQVTFDPSAAGARAATLTIPNSDDNENPYDFSIAGTGALLPEMDVLGNAVGIADGDTTPGPEDLTDFGSADIRGGTVTRTFTIRNTGSGALGLPGRPRVAITGHTADFKVIVFPTASVPAGGATTFKVRFDPLVVGTRVATITIVNSDPDERPYNFAVRGTGTSAPEINLFGGATAIADGDTTPAAADLTDFGGADVGGATVTRTFTIRNAGSMALALSGTPRVALSGPNAADFAVTVLPAASVAPAAVTTFQVRFDPSATGARLATVSIPSNDADESPYDFAIQGTGTVAPEIAVLGNGVTILDNDAAAMLLDHTYFGIVDITGGTVTRTFTIRNTGSGDLSLSGSPLVAIGGAGAADFSLTALPADLVAAGGSTTFQVTFDPSAAGARAATLTIPNSDTNENPYNFAILGTGALVPEMDLLGNGSSIPDGDTTPMAGDLTDFGSAEIAAGAVTHTFTITNSGSGALALSGTPRVAITGHTADFKVVVLPAAAVAAGGATTFQVRFDPVVAGTRAATVHIVNNDPDEKPYNFAVTGTGTSAPEINVYGNGAVIADGDATPGLADFTDFGTADLAGGTVTRTFIVRNAGSGSLSLSGSPRVAIGGPNAADFQLMTAPLASVAPAGVTTFQVRFDPTGVGTRDATLTIPNSDEDENPYDFAIRGTGTVAPEINVLGNGVSIVDGDAAAAAVDHTSFGTADLAYGSVARTFTIQNTGSGELQLSGSPLVAVGGAGAADFAVTALPSATVSPGGTTTFEVTFNPSTAGARAATLTIPNNDLSENPYNFAVSGTGVLAPEIDVTGNGVSIPLGDAIPSVDDHTDFGGAAADGGLVTRTFTIRNLGSGALALSGTPRVAVSGAHAADFAVSAFPAASVAAAGSTTFQVSFDPRATGLRSANLVVVNNDPNESPYNFAIQGNGTGGVAGIASIAGETASSTLETISRPVSPSGPTSLAAGTAYTFTTHGALSSTGDPVQYRFTWADGTQSEWLPVGVLVAAKSWAIPGTYTQVKAQARCAKHPTVVSLESAPLTVTIAAATAGETVTPPAAPAGPTSLSAMTTAVFRAGGAVSSSQEAVQYRFRWSDGTVSAWLPVGVREASKSWSVPGSYDVRVEARCAAHPSIVSQASSPLHVGITPGIEEDLVQPEPPVGAGEGQTGFLYAFDAKGASTSVGDPVQYRFQWGDGTTSGWLPAGEAAEARAWKFWSTVGIYSVMTEARCAVHNGLNLRSTPLQVQIDRGDPELFLETFSGGPAVDDSRWQIVSGGWALTAEETLSTDSPRVDSLAIVRPITDFAAGRLATRLKIGSAVPGDYVGIIFAYTDAQHYRYVALGDSNLFVGQVGETGAETDGVKATVKKSPAPGTWHQLRVDVHADGEVKAYLGPSEKPALVFRFADPAAGQVGFTSNTSEVTFDDFGIWDERVLVP